MTSLNLEPAGTVSRFVERPLGRFLGGDGITACPARRNYVARESMALRFEPLDPQAKEFSLVEGQGGENQMIDPASSKSRFWNFLRVKLK